MVTGCPVAATSANTALNFALASVLDNVFIPEEYPKNDLYD
jgi:hypothetical protein